MVQRSLYEMIGVDADADPADVRYAYEQAMRMATRGGDHRRAVELSAAYDSLQAQVRSRIFPAARSGPGSARGERSASLHPSDYDLGPMPLNGGRFGRSRHWGRTIGAVVLGLAIVLVVGLYVWQTMIPHTVRPSYQFPAGNSIPPAATGPQLVVPDDAPVGRDGLVTVACSGNGSSYDQAAEPGDTVSCNNGATPEIVTTG